MDVFRRAYASVGLGWLVAPTGWPLVRPVFDKAYTWFARYRPRFRSRGHRCTSGHCPALSSPASHDPVSCRRR
jgi:predicted DCC family thiol-disulfide oxidoreductase YuxK